MLIRDYTAATVRHSSALSPLSRNVPQNSFRALNRVLHQITLKIYRSSAPFNGAVEKGLYFIAFSCDPMSFDEMLQRMFGNWEDNEHDQLIHYRTPTSGSYWFAPSEEDFAAAGCIG